MSCHVDPMQWRIAQRKDPVIGPFVRFVTEKSKPNIKQVLNNTESKILLAQFDQLVSRRGVFYRKILVENTEKYQLVLPKSHRALALKGLHDDVGHMGRDRTLSLVRDRFYWPKMTTDVQNKIRSCDRCLKRKSSINVRFPLVSIHTFQPLELVCNDYLTLETSKGGYQNILVNTDHFTKYAVAIPTRNQTAKTTAEAFFQNFVSHYGFPHWIHSDQGLVLKVT